MATFNAEVNNYYHPKFEAETLADAIAYANENYLGERDAPRQFTDRNVCMAVAGEWVPAWLVDWSRVDAEWARPLANAQQAQRRAAQAAYDALCNR